MSFTAPIDDIINDKQKRLFAIAFVVTVAMTLILFRDAIAFMWERWSAEDELSHSFFIPLISGWLAWSNRDAVMKSIGDPSISALTIGLLASAMMLLAGLTYVFLFRDIGLIVAIAAIAAAVGGFSLVRILAVPIGFLLFAVPPPFWVITTLSWKMQNWSSELGVAMIKLMGIPVLLSGNIIDLGVTKLQVAEACSGLRYLFPFLSLGFLTAYLFRAPLWQRATVFLATIPITILMNSLRIAITGALVQAYGDAHTKGFLHFFEGWVVFLLCLAALIGVVAIFCLLIPPRRHVLDVLAPPKLQPITPSSRTMPILTQWNWLAALSGLFAITLLTSTFVNENRLIVPERKYFRTLPTEFPGWDYRIRPIDSEVAEQLKADDSIVADMISPEGDQINIYLAYLTARRDGTSWHSPRQCIPGGGWQVTEIDIIQASDESGELPFAYNRMLIEYGDQKQLVYYWYDQRGRKIANEYMMKLLVLYDTVTRRRADGSLVRLIAPVPESNDVASTEKKLKEFAMRLNGILPEYVPE